MATKRIPDIAPYDRRFVDEVEMIAMLNITRPQWEQFRLSDPIGTKPNRWGQYDRLSIEDLFAKSF